MSALVLSSLAFFAIHLVPATTLRPQMVKAIGEGPYLGLFSFASVIFLASMAISYRSAIPAAALWVPGTFVSMVLAFLMLIAFMLMVAGVASPNPAAIGGAAKLANDAVPHGIFTVTRHPLMLAIALWAVLHLIANPDLPSLVLFGSLAATALYGIPLQDRRKKSEIGAAWRRYQAQTSVIPFRAVIEGRARFDFAGIGWWRVGIAVALWAATLALHGAIFGAPALVV